MSFAILTNRKKERLPPIVNMSCVKKVSSLKPEIHYRVHKSSPYVSVLSQMNPAHNIPSYLFKILPRMPTYVL